MGGIAKRYALHPKENTGPGNFRDTVVQAAKLLGWRVYWTHHSKHSPPGFPDLVMVRDGIQVCAELKVKGRKPTPAQIEWLRDLAMVPGVSAWVWTPDDWPLIRETLARPLD